MLNAARGDSTLDEVVAMTRCSNFNANLDKNVEEQQQEYEEYVRSGRDPTLFFHLTGGAEILAIVENYRSQDTDNLGNAVLIRYNLRNVSLLRFMAQQFTFRNFIVDCYEGRPLSLRKLIIAKDGGADGTYSVEKIDRNARRDHGYHLDGSVRLYADASLA